MAFSASYVRGRHAEHGLARSAKLTAAAALTAVQIGVRVRRAPVLRPQPALLARPEELIQICSMVSDTHLVAAGRDPCELEVYPDQWRGAPPTCDQLAAGVRRVLDDIARNAPRTVIWCGDEVDTGDPEEWRIWREVVSAGPRLAHRVVPGNHDICFNRPFDEDYDLKRRALRESAFQDHAGSLGDFPIVDHIVGEGGPVTVVLLDSCQHRSTHILSNAVGHFGDIQLGELERILADTRGPVLCVSHHHVWRDARFLQPDAWYNTAIDADRLVSILVEYRRRDPSHQVLVCHGHRHSVTAGLVGDEDAAIAVVGLPSTTLGDKSLAGQLDGVLRYGIAGLRRDGTWGVALREAGALLAGS